MIGSIPPPRDQPVALVLWYLELLDRMLDSRLFVRLIKTMPKSALRILCQLSHHDPRQMIGRQAA
jgi:hypothetical protein